MLDSIQTYIFDNMLLNDKNALSLTGELICLLAAVILGLCIAFVYILGNKRHTKSFVTALVLIPAVVQIIIFLVSDNLGMGVAVAGAFSLVRFRSTPGTAKEICAVFFVTAVGITLGRGYLWFAVLITAILSIALLVLGRISLGDGESKLRQLRITVPESLEFDGVFDDLFTEYLKDRRLDRVKTTNMGSMYELRYTVTLKRNCNQKAFLDAIRVRNGNLPVSLGLVEQNNELL